MNLTLVFLLPLPVVPIFLLLPLGDARNRSLDRSEDRRHWLRHR